MCCRWPTGPPRPRPASGGPTISGMNEFKVSIKFKTVYFFLISSKSETAKLALATVLKLAGSSACGSHFCSN